jgi:23S rRNA (guanosine2251-2'-O)-methyltransferase
MTTTPQPDTATLEGHIAIRAALEAASRPVHALLLDRAARDREGHLARLARLAGENHVPVERVSREDIDAQVSGGTHGGALALCGPRRFVALEELLPNATAGHAPFVVMLDGVEDPFNFGQAIRALYAAGADGLVVRPRNWMSAAAIVARSSAGASERIPTAVAETAEDAARFFHGHALAVATTAQTRAIPLYAADLTGPLFLLIGGEKRGITRSFLEAADLVIAIPYGRAFPESLGTTAAAAVLAFEIMRQRRR